MYFILFISLFFFANPKKRIIFFLKKCKDLQIILEDSVYFEGYLILYVCVLCP